MSNQKTSRPKFGEFERKNAASNDLRMIFVLLIGADEVLWQPRHLDRLFCLRAVFRDESSVRKTAEGEWSSRIVTQQICSLTRQRASKLVAK